VIEALREQRTRTWKGNVDDFVFLNTKGRPVHPHTLNNCVINPTLKKMGITTHISMKDRRESNPPHFNTIMGRKWGVFRAPKWSIWGVFTLFQNFVDRL
jgi:hypothetical protein